MMLLAANNLSFSYDAAPVLREITFTLNAGEVVALLGPNGSGKSTLLRALLGQLSCSGQISWESRPLRDWSRRELARSVAYLPQTPTWDDDQRVSDILRMGRAPYLRAFGLESDRDIAIVHEVAATLELTELLSRRLDSLSGGQRQRVFIGRCLVQEPRAMLLDEPNTFLDLRHQVELGTLLVRLARQRNIAVLMASHDLNLAGQFAGRIVLLSEGRLVREGKPDEVLEPEILGSVYGLQMRRIEAEGRIHVFPVV
jgi:ABC-type cobalamin/Fe3+-siderophores transport system ATPase subunit